MPITLQQLVGIMPNAAAENRAAAWLSPLNDAMARFDINQPPRIAMFLANVAVETGELKARVESLRG